AVRIRRGGHPPVRCTVAENDPPLSFERLEGMWISEEVAFAVGNRDSEHLARSRVQRKSRVTLLNAQVDPLTSKLAGCIPEQRPRQQSCLLQDLKAVADSQHQSATIRKVADGLHHRCEAR